MEETVSGWSRKTVSRGLEELRTGVVIPDQPRNAVRKTEEKDSQLSQDIRDLVKPYSQADPKFQTTSAFTRITAKTVRQGLIEHIGCREEDLPSERTMGTVLNRMCYPPNNQTDRWKHCGDACRAGHAYQRRLRP